MGERVQWRRTEPPVRLTQRQFVFVALYVDGASVREAAEVLGVQFGTFHKLLRRIRSKFATAGIAAGTRIELERLFLNWNCVEVLQPVAKVAATPTHSTTPRTRVTVSPVPETWRT